jgi:AraC-like DNA-binding protein
LPLERPPAEEAAVHYVIKGHGIVESDGARVAISPGAIIVVPRHLGTRIIAAASQGGMDGAHECDDRSPEWTRRFRGDLVLACSTVSATVNGGIDLFERLEQPLAETPRNPKFMRLIFKILSEELAQPAFGTNIVAEAIVKQGLVLLMRAHLERLGIASPLFLPLLNSKLGGCIQAIIGKPDAAHSVGSLAKLAGMSESRFTARFLASYGKTPMKFVQAVRLQDAAILLRTSDLPLKAIAARVGYLSRSHLSRVFQAQFGTDPTTYRSAKRQVAEIF